MTPNAGVSESSKALDLNTPNREEPRLDADNPNKGVLIPHDDVIAAGMSQSPRWWQTGPSDNGRTSQ